jgi:hypothetical protein
VSCTRTTGLARSATGASYLIDAYPPAHYRLKHTSFFGRPQPKLLLLVGLYLTQPIDLPLLFTTPPSQPPSLLGHHVQKQLRQRFGDVLAAGPYLSGGICIRSGQARIGRCRHSQQNTRCTCRDQGAFNNIQYGMTVNTDTCPAKRRRTLVLPKEDHRDRCALRHCTRRPCLRCPRPIELHEAAVARLPPDIRPRNSPL